MNHQLRPIPFVRLVLPFLAGILLYEYSDLSYGIFFVLAVLGMVFTLFFSFVSLAHANRWLFGIVLWTGLLGGGYLAAHHHDESNTPWHFSVESEPELYVLGRIEAEPKKKRTVQSVVRIEGVGVSVDSIQSSRGRALVYIPMDTSSVHLSKGDLILMKTRFKPPRANLNPGGFDYGRYLHVENIHHTAFVYAGDWLVLERGGMDGIANIPDDIRSHVIHTLQKYIVSENEFSVASALVVGYKDEMTEDVRLAYANTGAMHVLAVSGLHVGIIYMLVKWLLMRIFPRRGKWSAILQGLISILTIWVFALVTGSAPSVMRASAMFSFLIIGDVLTRSKNIYNTLSGSAFVLLLFNPFILLSIGFQLSYLAVIGIVYFQPKIFRLWYIQNKLGKWFWNMTSVSLAAQVMTLPISLYYFHQFPTYFWLSGLIVVPAAPFILCIGILLVVIDLLLPVLGSLVGGLLWMILWSMNAGIFFIEKLPFHLIEGIRFGMYELLFSYFIIGLIILFIEWKKKWIFYVISITLLLFSLMSVVQYYANLDSKEIVVYHSRSGLLVDYVLNGKRKTIKSIDLQGGEELSVAKGYRIENGVFHDDETYMLEKDTIAPFISISESLLNLDEVSFYFLNKDYKTSRLKQQLTLDYLCIMDDPFVDFEVLAEDFEVGTLVILGSNSTRRVNFYKRKSKELGWDIHVTRESGALVLEL